MKDPCHFCHFRRVDKLRADPKPEVLLAFEERHLIGVPRTIHVAVLGRVQQVLPLDRTLGDGVGGAFGLIGRFEKQLGGIAFPERLEQPDAPDEFGVVVGHPGGERRRPHRVRDVVDVVDRQEQELLDARRRR